MEQNNLRPLDDDEVDLREFLAALVAHWRLIGGVSLICVIFAGYYAYNVATPKYASEAVFEMPTSEGSSLGGLGELAALSGLALPGNGGANVFDQIQGRDFIVEIAAELDLAADPFFNGSLKPPGTRTRFLRSIGLLGPAEAPTAEGTISGVVGTFRKNVDVSETPNGAFSIKTIHTDPNAAARLSNAVVQKILIKHRNKQIADQRARVDYLSSELAKAREDLDRAVEQVQAFAVANNMLSVQELMQQSQQLVKMRDRKGEITANIAALEALRDYLGLASRDAAGLEALLDENQQLQQREILLLLGEPGAPADWLAIAPKRVDQTLTILAAQLVQIERSLAEFQKEASATAENAAELAKRERDVTVATATYEVMVEQFKAQAVAAGFELSLGTIFETAVPALKPSQPKKSLILALGMVLGLFIGSGIALIRSARAGGLHSITAVTDLLGPSSRVYRGRALWPQAFGGIALPQIGAYRKHAAAELSELSYALNSDTKPVLIVPATAREAVVLAELVADQVTEPESKTLVVDVFAQMPAVGGGVTRDGFQIESRVNGLEIARPETPDMVHARQVTRGDFLDHLKALTVDYDRVVLLTAPLDQASYMMRALRGLEPLVLTTARPRKVTSGGLRQLLALMPEGWQKNEGLLVIC